MTLVHHYYNRTEKTNDKRDTKEIRKMKLITRRFRQPGYDLHLKRNSFQDQVQLIIVLACLLGHLALFQLADTSAQSSSLKLFLSFGNATHQTNSSSSDENAFRNGHSRGQEVISSVPEEERGMFILYHLVRSLNPGISKDNAITPRLLLDTGLSRADVFIFKNIPTYDTFSADLLNWTMRTVGAKKLDVLSLQRGRKVLCTSKRLCFNPNDIGSMCCPF